MSVTFSHKPHVTCLMPGHQGLTPNNCILNQNFDAQRMFLTVLWCGINCWPSIIFCGRCSISFAVDAVWRFLCSPCRPTQSHFTSSGKPTCHVSNLRGSFTETLSNNSWILLCKNNFRVLEYLHDKYQEQWCQKNNSKIGLENFHSPVKCNGHWMGPDGSLPRVA